MWPVHLKWKWTERRQNIYILVNYKREKYNNHPSQKTNINKCIAFVLRSAEIFLHAFTLRKTALETQLLRPNFLCSVDMTITRFAKYHYHVRVICPAERHQTSSCARLVWERTRLSYPGEGWAKFTLVFFKPRHRGRAWAISAGGFMRLTRGNLSAGLQNESPSCLTVTTLRSEV